MSRDDLRKAQELLLLNGYELHRIGKHDVYKHRELGLTQICSRSPSDFRFLEKKRQDIRKQLREHGREMIENRTVKRKREGEVVTFNTPRMKEDLITTGNQAQDIFKTEQPAKAEKRINLNAENMNEEVKSILINGRANGWKLDKMQDALTQLGYRQLNGGVIHGATISAALCDLGYRKDKKQERKKKEKVDSREFVQQALNPLPVPQVPQPQYPPPSYAPRTGEKRKKKESSSTFIDELTELLTSNLEVKLKEKLAITMIKEKSGWFNPPQ